MQTLAKKVLGFFTESTRENGEKFKHLRENAPEWMTDLCHDAHGRMLPDDFKFQFIYDALQAIADHDDTDEARDSLAPDTWTKSRLDWLASNLSRTEYVNQAVQDFGAPQNFDVSEVIGQGQLLEMQEVFDSVVNSLEENEDETEDAA